MAQKINVTESLLRSKVSTQTYQRAQEYVEQFACRTIDGGEISGKVEGNYGIYITFLEVSDNRLEGRCSCRAADDMFCKHAVALGLTYLESPDSFVKKEKVGRREITSLDDVVGYLDSVTLDEAD